MVSFNEGTVQEEQALYSAQQNPDSYLALFRLSKLRKYRWVENASLGIFSSFLLH